jgi:hypothetical protein
VMKTAHQNVPVAGLPGLSGGVPVASVRPSADIPRRPQMADAGGNVPVPASAVGGLDDWLLGKLFGRR